MEGKSQLKEGDLSALALDLSQQARSLSLKGQLLASALQSREADVPATRLVRDSSDPFRSSQKVEFEPLSVHTRARKELEDDDWVAVPERQSSFSKPGIFRGSVFAFDCLNAYELRTIVEEHGGETRYGLSPECTHLVSSNIANGSTLVNRAKNQEGTAIVSESFLVQCVKEGRLLSPSEAGEANEHVAAVETSAFVFSPIKIPPSSTPASSSSSSLSSTFAGLSIDRQIKSPETKYEPSALPVHSAKPREPSPSPFGESFRPTPAVSERPAMHVPTPAISTARTFPAPARTIPPKEEKAAKEEPEVEQVHPEEGNKEYELLKFDLLQATDIETNHNKYYALEIHHFTGANTFRVFTHYGRTDDLEKDPMSGQRQSRPCPTFKEATKQYEKLLKDKTGPNKGYKALELASSKIGSSQLKRQVRELYAKQKGAVPSLADVNPADLSPAVRDLVEYLYEEATQALTTAVAVNITSRGIETPLGILTLAQIQKGERTLSSIEGLIVKLEKNATKSNPALQALSGEFYTHIPHRLGRSRTGVQDAVITTMAQVEEKRELLQLMEDMLTINASGGSHAVLKEGVGFKYVALRCNISHTQPGSLDFTQVKSLVEDSQLRPTGINVKNVFALKRPAEASAFVGDTIPNHKQLFHGSRVCNWVGILSRGLLMPKKIVAMGGKLTNVGWLGSGLYFAENACTTTRYAFAGNRGTKFILVNTVACGTPFHTTKIDSSLTRAPPGTHSAHGVSSLESPGSDFEDHEWVVYQNNQTTMSYLVEFVADDKLRLPPPSKLGERKAEEQVKVEHKAFEKPAAAPAMPAFSFAPPPAAAPPAAAPAAAIPFSFGAPSVSPAVEKKTPAPFNFGSSPAPAASPFYAAFTTAPAVSGPLTTISSSASTVGIPKSSFPADADAQNSWMKQRDDHLRAQYATNRNSPEIADLYVHLIDVYHPTWANSFVFESLSPSEQAIPRVLAEHINPNPPIGSPTIVPLQTFNHNWNVFTQNQLNGLDWSNVFVAGGCVMACLMPHSKFADGSGFKSSDIDIFLYGLTPEQATEKVRHIYNIVAKNRPPTEKAPEIIRTAHAITILGQFPARHIQIVLRLYKAPAEVLLGFDIDACTAGYNGSNVVVTPRCRRSLNKQYCLVDLSRRSLTYEVRLFKYSKRGFAVAVPAFRGPASVDARLFQSTPAREQGLARLLLYGRQEEAKIRGKGGEDNWQAAELEVLNSENPDKDYDNLLIPFGPAWHQWKILEVLTKRDMAQFFKNKQHKHVFVSGLEGVINGYSRWCKICQKDMAAGVKFVHREGASKEDDMRGPIQWLQDNPGRQLMTGSFHPLPEKDWEKHVYDASEVHAVSPKKSKAPSFLGASATGAPFTEVAEKQTKNLTKKALKLQRRMEKMKKFMGAKQPALPAFGFTTGPAAGANAPVLRELLSVHGIALTPALEAALLGWKANPAAN